MHGYKEKELPCKDRGFCTDLTFLELENRELKMKIRRLEKELADKVLFIDIILLATRLKEKKKLIRSLQNIRSICTYTHQFIFMCIRKVMVYE